MAPRDGRTGWREVTIAGRSGVPHQLDRCPIGQSIGAADRYPGRPARSADRRHRAVGDVPVRARAGRDRAGRPASRLPSGSARRAVRCAGGPPRWRRRPLVLAPRRRGRRGAGRGSRGFAGAWQGADRGLRHRFARVDAACGGPRPDRRRLAHHRGLRPGRDRPVRDRAARPRSGRGVAVSRVGRPRRHPGRDALPGGRGARGERVRGAHGHAHPHPHDRTTMPHHARARARSEPTLGPARRLASS